MKNSASTDVLPSQLLPDLLEKSSQASPMLMLDVGYGRQDTIAFFTRQRCRLHFGGLFEVPEAAAAPPATSGKTVQELDEDAWFALFETALDFPPETRFDLCLFWDFFNYLNDTALTAFHRALAPYLHHDTVGHCFVALNRDSQIPQRIYGLLDSQQFSVQPRPPSSLQAHPCPQARLRAALNGLMVNQSVLHRNGLLEVSLRGL